jgi:hypothetical protein
MVTAISKAGRPAGRPFTVASKLPLSFLQAGAAHLRDDSSEHAPTTASGDRVRMRSAGRSASQPRTSRDLRRRFRRHHVPLGLASAVVLGVFMSFPAFEANRYPHADIFSGTFPQQRQRGGAGPGVHRGGQAGPMTHGRAQMGPVQHGADHTAPMGAHGRSQTSRSNETRSDPFLGLSIRGLTVATGYVATGLLRSHF